MNRDHVSNRRESPFPEVWRLGSCHCESFQLQNCEPFPGAPGEGDKRSPFSSLYGQHGWSLIFGLENPHWCLEPHSSSRQCNLNCTLHCKGPGSRRSPGRSYGLASCPPPTPPLAGPSSALRTVTSPTRGSEEPLGPAAKTAGAGRAQGPEGRSRRAHRAGGGRQGCAIRKRQVKGAVRWAAHYLSHVTQRRAPIHARGDVAIDAPPLGQLALSAVLTYRPRPPGF